MRGRLLLALLLFLTHTKTLAAESRLSQFILDGEIRQAVEAGDTYLQAPFKAPVRSPDGQTFRTCGEVREPIPDSTSCELNLCLRVAALKKGVSHQGYRPSYYTRELYQRLDLSTLPLYGVSRSSLKGSGNFMANYELLFFTIVDARRIVYEEGEGVKEVLTLLGDADLNNNSKPDWLLGVEFSRSGDATPECSTYVIHDVEPTGTLKALPLPGW